MKVVEERVIRVPVDEIRLMIEKQCGVDLTGAEAYLDGDSLAFSVPIVTQTASGSETDLPIREFRAKLDTSFDRPEREGLERKLNEVPGVRIEKRARRRRRKRNRVRTRGWPVVERIMNSKGLPANVYEPLVRALEGKEITRSEQKKLVRQLMVENGNDPSSESVEYFLENTLEYLRMRVRAVEQTS
ncbi:MAG TPA: hypothetical protein VF944_01500 [Candidatus Bathyarchaeia archaeon]